MKIRETSREVSSPRDSQDTGNEATAGEVTYYEHQISSSPTPLFMLFKNEHWVKNKVHSLEKQTAKWYLFTSECELHTLKRNSLLYTITTIFSMLHIVVTVGKSVVWVRTQYQNIPDIQNKLLIHIF